MKIFRKHFESLDSTNTWAKQNPQECFFDALTVVTADLQTRGRGSFEKSWESPPGLNLYVSFCFFLRNSPQNVGNIPQILSLSVVEALQPLGIAIKIKWPNDLMVADKKLGGILCETTTIQEALFVVAGLGLNINMPQEMLECIDQPATSLLVAQGIFFDREEILQRIIERFRLNLERFVREGFRSFLSSLKEHLIYQRTFKVRRGNQLLEGTFHSLDEEGVLHIRLSSGVIERV